MEKALLIILDGFGTGKDSEFNAIKNAKMPFYRELERQVPNAQLLTHGEAVGLPKKTMGNSEVGHMTLGSGRILFHDLVRINEAIETGTFETNVVLEESFQKTESAQGRVHLMGLLSDGGVHSHIDHVVALNEYAKKRGLPTYVHAFLDGRDTPPTSSLTFLSELLNHPTQPTIASLSGRYFAMDRDRRWERTEQAAKVLLGDTQVVTRGPLEVIRERHEKGEHDEFIEPTLINAEGAIRDGDLVLFFNFRADRARQITEWITQKSSVRLGQFVCMTEYDSKFKLPVLFPKAKPQKIFGEVLAQNNLQQLRIAETEKYAHVTFFFNSGRETPFPGEERILVPSPRDVETYDQKPKMSAGEVTKKAIEKIKKNQHHFILMNYANPDMVGHTGNYDAAVESMEFLDQCLDQVVSTAAKKNVHVIITADHGNIEEMKDHDGRPHTQHTLNPVPLLWVNPSQTNAMKIKDGTLADVIPTLAGIMNVPLPTDMTGKSLIYA